MSAAAAAGKEEAEQEEALVLCGAAGGGAYLACRLMASTLTGTASGLLSTTSTRPSSPQTCRGGGESQAGAGGFNRRQKGPKENDTTPSHLCLAEGARDALSKGMASSRTEAADCHAKQGRTQVARPG